MKTHGNYHDDNIGYMNDEYVTQIEFWKIRPRITYRYTRLVCVFAA